MPAITLGELAGRVGEKPRTLQFWADNGVLQTTPESRNPGKGKPKLFPEDEERFARLAKKLAWTNSPIGEIRQVVDFCRCLDFPQALDWATGRMADESSSARGDPASKGQGSESLRYLLSTFLLFGIAGDELSLVISYLQEDGRVRSIVDLQMPDGKLKSVPTKLRPGYIGQKIIPVSLKADIWGAFPPSEIDQALMISMAKVAIGKTLSTVHERRPDLRPQLDRLFPNKDSRDFEQLGKTGMSEGLSLLGVGSFEELRSVADKTDQEDEGAKHNS